MRIPYKSYDVGDYHVEWYRGDHLGYMTVYRKSDRSHIATFYSEQELNKFITN